MPAPKLARVTPWKKFVYWELMVTDAVTPGAMLPGVRDTILAGGLIVRLATFEL
jgi:hypothetical protein